MDKRCGFYNRGNCTAPGKYDFWGSSDRYRCCGEERCPIHRQL